MKPPPKKRKSKPKEAIIDRSHDPSVKLMKAPCWRPLASPVTPASVAAALACEVGVHGCRPAPCCRAINKDLLDPSFPIRFYARPDGEQRWVCEAGCESDDGKPLDGGALSFAVAFMFGTILSESDPRVTEARGLLRDLAGIGAKR